MPDPNLLEYLDQTITLERECYTLNKLIEYGESQRTASQEEPTEPDYPEPPTFPPPPKSDQLPLPPLWISWSDFLDTLRKIGLWTLTGGAVVAIIILAFDLHNKVDFLFQSPTGNFLLIWGVSIFIIFTIAGTISEAVEDKKRFPKGKRLIDRQPIKQHAADIKEYYAHNARIRIAHNQQIFDLKTAYETALAAAQARNESAGQIIPALDALQRRFQAAQYKLHQTLAQLYALEMIYPKCHNLIALSSLHEYISSGRCDELAGADGAYELLDQGIRSRQIVYRMTDIPDDLERIETRQYKLYTVLTAARQTITAIGRAITERLNLLAASANADDDTTEQAPPPAADQVEQYLGKLDTIHAGALAYLARHV